MDGWTGPGCPRLQEEGGRDCAQPRGLRERESCRFDEGGGLLLVLCRAVGTPAYTHIGWSFDLLAGREVGKSVETSRLRGGGACRWVPITRRLVVVVYCR